MKHEFLLLLPLFAALCGCGTIDVEKETRAGTGPVLGRITDGGEPENPALERESYLIENTLLEMKPEVIFMEKPVYVPKPETPPQRTATGVPAANAAAARGTKAPSERDFSATAAVYDFNPDWVYEVYASPSRVTDICLEEDETALDVPFISDSDRWILGGGKSMAGGATISHIYVKPKERGLSASLIINTDRRVYHILLRSYEDTYMPIVRWQYKLYEFPKGFFAREGAGGNGAADGGSPLEVSHEIAAVDPRFLSFDYKIVYELLDKPAWLPRLVYDDGKKTYIAFEENVFAREFPAVFENRSNIVNYRVSANLIIIDRLVERVTLKLGKQAVAVEKKKSKKG
jgi:type IV secretion system protein VirB9